jgi:isopentenyl-diphosphate delta-isomerase
MVRMPTKIDIVNKFNEPTGKVATYDDVHNHGLWQRGVHVVIYTPDKKILMQKRDGSLKYHPGEIEVSVGGGVDTGEEPLQAGVREVYEETGLRVNPAQLKFLGIKKFNHTYKHQGKERYMRVFLYAYKVCVSEEELQKAIPAAGEVERIFIMPKRKLLWSLRRHYIRGFGRIVSTYAYWAYLVKTI